MKNNQKGITLVALVITIIVLLILAGVTIAALSGDNGILNRGSQSKVQTNIANAKDLINVEVQEHITDYYNAKYVNSSSSDTNVTSGKVGAYVAAKMAAKTGQAASVIDSVSGLVITTKVKDAKDATLTATLNETTGAITWSGDAMTK